MTSSSNRERDIAIVGVAESDEMGTVPNKSSLQHHAEAAWNALDDAGLAKSDINGLLTAGFSTLATAEYLGIQPGFTDNTSVGGSSFVIHIAHAAAAIRAATAIPCSSPTGRPAGPPAPVSLPTPTFPSPSTRPPTAWLGSPSTTLWPAPATCTSTARTTPARAWPK